MELLRRLIGQTIDDKYFIEAKLGQGGMGAVFLATHLGTKRPVALKVIAPEFMANAKFVERFKHEAEAAGRLRHPNVVNVTDFGFAMVDSDRIAYLVMEYLDGYALADLIDENGPLPLELVVDIVDQICLAVDKAHEHGIIHRDLKPDNIWLEPNGRGAFNVKVLDFGLAKLRDPAPLDMQVPPKPKRSLAPTADGSNRSLNSASAAIAVQIKREEIDEPNDREADGDYSPEGIINEDEKVTGVLDMTPQKNRNEPSDKEAASTAASSIVGTPIYMSPEQWRKDRLDSRTDVYSLGVIVYEMLTGDPPFSGDIYSIMRKHLKELPPNPKKSRPDIPSSVADVVMSALSKSPDLRPPTACAFSSLLHANVEGEVPILQEAVDVYRKHAGLFLRVASAVFAPFVIAVGLLLFFSPAARFQELPSFVPHLFHGCRWVLSILLILFACTLNTSACSLIMERLGSFPKSPPNAGAILAATWRKFGTLAYAALRSHIDVVSQLFRFIKPGLRACADNSLTACVVMNEGKSGVAALERSKRLACPLRSIASPLQLREIFLSLTTLVLSVAAYVFCSFLLDALKPAGLSGEALMIVFTLTPVGFIALFHPVVAVAFSILYLRSRASAGERTTSVEDKKVKKNFALMKTRSKAPFLRAAAIGAALLAAIAVWPMGRDEALRFGVRRNYPILVKACLAAGADAEAEDRYGAGDFIYSDNDAPARAFAYAAYKGNREVVDIFITAGAKIDERSEGGETALFFAAAEGHAETVEKLLSAGADIRIRNDNEQTALMWTSDGKIVEALIKAGLSVRDKDRNGVTPLLHASTLNHKDAVEALLKAGADVNERDHFGMTALIRAVKLGRLQPEERVKRKTEHWEEIEIMRPVFHTDLVERLLTAGCDVNAKDKDGASALMYASINNYADFVKILLQAGADVQAKDNGGKTALTYVAEPGPFGGKENLYHNYEEIVRSLVAAGDDPVEADNDGNTALFYAEKKGYLRISKALGATEKPHGKADEETSVEALRSDIATASKPRQESPEERLERVRSERAKIELEYRRRGDLSPAVLSFVLPPASTRGGSGMTLTVPQKARAVRIILEIDPAYDDLKLFRAQLSRKQGEIIWTKESLAPERRDSKLLLVLTPPVDLLTDDKYSLKLSGLLGDGEYERLPDYSFEINRSEKD